MASRIREFPMAWEFPKPREIPVTREFPRLKLFPPISRETEICREFPAHGFPLNITGLCTVLGSLTDLALPTNIPTTAQHMGPPDPRRQQLVHLLSPEMSRKLSAMGLIQQQLPA